MVPSRFLAIAVLLVLLLGCTAVWLSPPALAADRPSPTPQTGVVETTVAVSRSDSSPLPRYPQPAVGWARSMGETLALLVIGTMLLGLAAAVRRVE